MSDRSVEWVGSNVIGGWGQCFVFVFFVVVVVFFFFKQKTAYEILTCDWSSDVCSSDLSPIQKEANILVQNFAKS